MGVQGLWQLVESAGRPVPIETLENKVLAVDISIWLNQALKGFRDPQGGPLSNAHVLGLFHRICKLLFYKIRPVFVFDGGVPQLKRQTLIARHQRKTEAQEGISKAQQKILANYVKRRMLGKIKNINLTLKNRSSNKYQDDIFKLPPASGMDNEDFYGDEKPDEWHLHCAQREMFFNEYRDVNIVHSEDFQALPPEIKYEILTNLKELSKRDRVDDMPEESSDFSSYQMNKIIKKRSLQQKIEETQKEMNTSVSKLGGFFYDEEDEEAMAEVRRIASEDFHHFILVRNKKKEEEKETNQKEVVQELPDKPGSSQESTSKPAVLTEEDYLLKLYREDPLSYSKIMLKECEDEVTSGKNETNDSLQVGSPNMSASQNKTTKHTLSNNGRKEIIYIESDSDAVVPEQPAIDEESYTQSSIGKQAQKEQNPFSTIYDSQIIFEEDSLEEKSDEIFKKSTEDPEVIYVNLPSTESKAHKDSNVKKAPVEVVISDNDSVEEQSEKIYLLPQIEEPTSDKCRVPQYSNEDKSESTSEMNRLVKHDDEIQSKVLKRHLGDENDISEIECIKEYIRQTDDGNDDLVTGKQATTSGIVINIDITQPPKDDLFSDVLTASHDDVNKPNKELDVFPYTEEELEMLDKELEKSEEELTSTRNKLERQSATVADHMYKECQELLRLFGIPYVISPMEAEAQCAELELLGLTQGSITDDSDIWLFGGKHVYKNFFSQDKYVELYKSTDIFSHFGLNQEKMIAFAMLTGSDYTVGVEGIGPVTAMEIFSEFPSLNGMDTLLKFKEWLELARRQKALPGTPTKAKLIRFELDDGFPSEVIYSAYLKPAVDSSQEPFSWGIPSLAELREYAIEKFGWTKAKADELLLPVLKKISDRQAQLRIDSFFSVHLQKKEKLFPSKRLQNAVRKLTSQPDEPKQSMEAHHSDLEEESSKSLPKKSKLSNKASSSRKEGFNSVKSDGNKTSKGQRSKDAKMSQTASKKMKISYRARMASRKVEKEVNLSESSDSS